MSRPMFRPSLMLKPGTPVVEVTRLGSREGVIVKYRGLGKMLVRCSDGSIFNAEYRDLFIATELGSHPPSLEVKPTP